MALCSCPEGRGDSEGELLEENATLYSYGCFLLETCRGADTPD